MPLETSIKDKPYDGISEMKWYDEWQWYTCNEVLNVIVRQILQVPAVFDHAVRSDLAIANLSQTETSAGHQYSGSWFIFGRALLP